MRLKPSSSLFAIAIAQSALLVLAGASTPAYATPGAAGAPPADFRLPPAPTPTPTSTPVQGPIDIEGPVPVAPRVIATPRPTPTITPTPAPAQRQLPTILTPPAPRAAPENETRRFTPAARAMPGQRVPGEELLSGEESPLSTQDLTPAEPVLDSLPSSAALPGLSDGGDSPSIPNATQDGSGQFGSTFWMALAAGLLALLAGFFVLRSRRQTATVGAPSIEPPLVRQPDPAPSPASARTAAPTPAPAPAPAPIPAPAKARATAKPTMPISLSVIPAKLSRSMMNATLSCAITVHNGTAQTFENLQISGDLVTAHGKISIGDQLADGSTQLAPLTTITSLPAGETGEVTARLNLPVGQIRTIAQGRAQVFVPLLRLRVSGEGADPVTHTFVIGMKPPGSSKVQPFRLDEMPQTYSQIGSRPLD